MVGEDIRGKLGNKGVISVRSDRSLSGCRWGDIMAAELGKGMVQPGGGGPCWCCRPPAELAARSRSSQESSWSNHGSCSIEGCRQVQRHPLTAPVLHPNKHLVGVATILVCILVDDSVKGDISLHTISA